MDFIIFFILYFVISIILLQFFGIVIPSWLIFLVFIIIAIVRIYLIVYKSKYEDEEEDK